MNRSIVALLLSTSVAMAEPTIFPYVFKKTTGINKFIVRDGREVPIEFSARSDKTALAMLYALDWRVIYACANGKHIFLRGELSPEIKRTPESTKDRQYPTPENYQEFTLLDWHITTPFPTYEYVDPDKLPTSTKTIMRASLKQAGFDTFTLDGKVISYARFQRPKAKALK